MTWTFFLRFIQEEFPWAIGRYRELFPRPGSAPWEYRESIDRRVEGLARAAGFPAQHMREDARRRMNGFSDDAVIGIPFIFKELADGSQRLVREDGKPLQWHRLADDGTPISDV